MIVALAVLPQPPTEGNVVLGILTVVAGALVAATAAHLGRTTGNWLYHLGTAAGLLIVAGVAGQRSAVDGSPMGPWDAGILVPLVGVRLTPVAAAGVLLAVLCLTLVLLLEHHPEPGSSIGQSVHRALEDDDAI